MAPMKNRRNYYRLLHVGRDAPTAVIQASYRALMQRLKMHPDLGGDHAQAALINEAYATLSDPAKRAAYDRLRPPTGDGVFGRRRADGAALVREPDRRADGEVPGGPGRAARGGGPGKAADAGGQADDGKVMSVARAVTRLGRMPSAKAMAECAFCAARCPAGHTESPDSTCTQCGSALFAAPKHHVADASRRAIDRLPRTMPVTLRTASSRHVVWSGETEDVSLNGMRLFSCMSIPVGERVRVDCAFCSAVAIVKSTRIHNGDGRHGWECGVEFITLRLRRTRGGLLSALG